MFDSSYSYSRCSDVVFSPALSCHNAAHINRSHFTNVIPRGAKARRSWNISKLCHGGPALLCFLSRSHSSSQPRLLVLSSPQEVLARTHAHTHSVRQVHKQRSLILYINILRVKYCENWQSSNLLDNQD
jgi:hypothetical protein